MASTKLLLVILSSSACLINAGQSACDAGDESCAQKPTLELGDETSLMQKFANVAKHKAAAVKESTIKAKAAAAAVDNSIFRRAKREGPVCDEQASCLMSCGHTPAADYGQQVGRAMNRDNVNECMELFHIADGSFVAYMRKPVSVGSAGSTNELGYHVNDEAQTVEESCSTCENQGQWSSNEALKEDTDGCSWTGAKFEGCPAFFR